MTLRDASVIVANMADLDVAMDLARLVEANGYSRIWLAETNSIDAAALGGAIARETSLEVGTAIVPVYSRTPALLSMMAGTWSALGGGRAVHLGIGAGGQTIVEDWHGVAFDRPLGTVRDTVGVLREAFSGAKTSYDGEVRTSRGFRLAYGEQPRARVYIGGMGPRMQQLAAERADGLIVTWLSPHVLSTFRTEFDRNVMASGRDRSDITLVARAYVAVTDDVETVREEVRREMVEYLVSPPYGRYFSSVGFDDEVRAAREAFSRGDRQGTARAVSDRLLDDVLVVGREAEEIGDALRAYLDAGADDLMVQPVPPSRGGDPARTIAAVANALS